MPPSNGDVHARVTLLVLCERAQIVIQQVFEDVNIALKGIQVKQVGTCYRHL